MLEAKPRYGFKQLTQPCRRIKLRHLNIIQLTPGAGAMYCGNCLRDNALVRALRSLGHHVTMVPLYLPLRLDEPDQSAETPVFFGGISVYLEQQWPWFRKAPAWVRQSLASRRLLRWAAGRAAKTRAAELGDLTLSMLQGEAGNQASELELLLDWLRLQPPPDIICLSNALLLGMARGLKALGAPVVCMLQGEDSFLDALPARDRARCWQALAERASEVDLFVSPSRYFAALMQERLNLESGRVEVVHNGINLEGYEAAPQRRAANAADRMPVLGYFTRMCPEKGLDLLVQAYMGLRQRGCALRLRIGGSCGPADEPFVAGLRRQLEAAGILGEVEFHPNLDRAAKLKFLAGLSLFSVPARYGEAFGLYVIEALAAGVPVVQPRTAAFTELVELTGGGLLCTPEDAKSLADGLEALLHEPNRARALGEAGRAAVFERFSSTAMARSMLGTFARCRPPTRSKVRPAPTGSSSLGL